MQGSPNLLWTAGISVSINQEKKATTKDEQPKDAAPCDFEEDGLKKKMVIRDTQRNKCQCFIKLVASPSGELRVSGSCGQHSHPISSCRTIYATHRKQSQDVMDLIMRTLSLPTPNPVETVMQVSYLKYILILFLLTSYRSRYCA